MSEQNLDLVEYTPAEWEDGFFEAYFRRFGVIAEAAREAGISYDTVRKRVLDNTVFKEKLATAKELVKEETQDRIRYENFRRAFEPVEEPIYQRGVFVGVKYVFDNKHLEWLSERMMPEEFHIPTRIEFAGDSDGAVHFKLQLNPGGEPGEDESK